MWRLAFACLLKMGESMCAHCPVSCSIHFECRKEGSYQPGLCDKKDKDPEKVSNLSKVTQPVKVRAELANMLIVFVNLLLIA